MSMGSIPLGFADITVPAGSHIAYSYQDEEKRRSDLFAFVREGLQNNEKCIIAVPEYAHDLWYDGLRTMGLTSLPIDKQIQILAPNQITPSSPSDLPKAIIDPINKGIKQSIEEGWGKARICLSTSHLYSKIGLVGNLLTTETSITDMITGKDAVVVCTFDAGRLHPELIEICRRCHPLTTDGASIALTEKYIDSNSLEVEMTEIMRKLNSSGALAPPFTLLDFHDNTPVIRTGDELDFYTITQFQELADFLINAGHRKLIVDLSKTTFIDAASVTAFLKTVAALDEKNGRFAIYDPSGFPRKIFELAKIYGHLSVFTELDEAADAVADTHDEDLRLSA